MSLLAWIILGLVAGCVASKIVNKSGQGFVLDIVLGIVGAVAFKSVVTVTFFYAGVTMSLGVVALFAWGTRRLNGLAISAALLAGLIASTAEAFIAGVTARTATVNAGVTALVTMISLAVLSLAKKPKPVK